MRDLGRILLHLPVGVAAALITAYMVPLGVVFWASWMVYELDEDWRISDSAYKDIAGFIWGVGLGALALWAWR